MKWWCDDDERNDDNHSCTISSAATITWWADMFDEANNTLTGIKAYFKWILIWSRYAPCTLLTVWLQIKQNDRREKKFIYYTIFMCMKRNANKKVGCKSDVKNIIEIRIAVIRSFCINFYTKPHWILLTLDVTCDKRENKSERKEKQIMVIQWWIKVLVVVLPLLWIFNRYTFSLADR